MTPRDGVPATLLFGPNALQVRASSIVAYTQADCSGRKGSRLSLIRLLNPARDRAYSGTLKAHARRRLRRACEILALCTPQRRVWNPVTQSRQLFKLAFVTLTLPVDLSQDQEKRAYRDLLKPFLQYLNRSCGVQSYVWRVELTAKGRPHWHIAINEWVHYQHIQNGWNRVLRKAGLLASYAAVHGHYNPHSTEIKSTRDVSKAMKYLSKYMSKAVQGDKRFSGKIWDASTALKGQRWPVYDICLTTLMKILGPDQGRGSFVAGDERFLMFDVDLSEVVDDTLHWLHEAFDAWKRQMADLLYSPPLSLVS